MSLFHVCQCTTCQDTPRYTLRLGCPTLTVLTCEPELRTRTKPPVCLKHESTQPPAAVQVATYDETDLHLRPPPHTPMHYSHTGPTAEWPDSFAEVHRVLQGAILVAEEFPWRLQWLTVGRGEWEGSIRSVVRVWCWTRIGGSPAKTAVYTTVMCSRTAQFQLDCSFQWRFCRKGSRYVRKSAQRILQTSPIRRTSHGWRCCACSPLLPILCILWWRRKRVAWFTQGAGDSVEA